MQHRNPSAQAGTSSDVGCFRLKVDNVSVTHGWQHILAKAVEEASKLPPGWMFDAGSIAQQSHN